MTLKNLESLIDGNGDVTVGSVGPIRCAAVAADDDQMLAALVRRPGESLLQLLEQLDGVLPHGWKHEDFVDEINAPPNPPVERAGGPRNFRGGAPKTAGRSPARR